MTKEEFKKMLAEVESEDKFEIEEGSIILSKSEAEELKSKVMKLTEENKKLKGDKPKADVKSSGKDYMKELFN